MSNRLKASKQLTDLEKSKEGKKLIEIQKEMNDKLKYIEDSKTSLNTDSLTSKAKNLLNNIIK